jgi:hypothetical protein
MTPQRNAPQPRPFTARAAGLAGVWLDRLGSRESRHVPPVISSLSDLPDVLERPDRWGRNQADFIGDDKGA